jgi:hypothetical protein
MTNDPILVIYPAYALEMKMRSMLFTKLRNQEAWIKVI